MWSRVTFIHFLYLSLCWPNLTETDWPAIKERKEWIKDFLCPHLPIHYFSLYIQSDGEGTKKSKFLLAAAHKWVATRAARLETKRQRTLRGPTSSFYFSLSHLSHSLYIHGVGEEKIKKEVWDSSYISKI